MYNFIFVDEFGVNNQNERENWIWSNIFTQLYLKNMIYAIILLWLLELLF